MNFDLDFAVFPKPSKPSYSLYNPNLIWIPRAKNAPQTTDSSSNLRIPCLFLPSNEPSNQLIIYFHANAEDIGMTELLFFPLRSMWKCHILSVEYPSYGQYQEHPVLSEESIYEDAESVYTHVQTHYGVKESQIVVFGRSLGTAPAVHLAAKFKPSGVMLISPFCSIRAAAGSMSFDFLASFVRERFSNESRMDKVTCPLLIIHGLKDGMIPVKQSHTLINLAASEKKRLITPQEMTHHDFDLLNDLGLPISRFLGEGSGNKQDLGGAMIIPHEEAIDWERFFPQRVVQLAVETTHTDRPLQESMVFSEPLQSEEDVGSLEPPENFISSQIDEYRG